MSKEVIPILKEEIEQVFGRKILSSRDCLDLSEEIFNKVGVTINANTLRRIFGLVKSDYPPSSTTLGILAQYCGCNSTDELLHLNHRNNTSFVFSPESILSYLVGIFKEIQVKDASDETFLLLVKHTIIFINRNGQFVDKFQREIARTKNGQKFYFEQFINMDKLNSYYGHGLRYYMAEKKTEEAQVFGHSLLALRYWLTGEHEKLEKEFNHVCENNIGRNFHPSVCGWYYAAQLYHAHANGSPTEMILLKAQKSWSSLVGAKKNYKSFPCFENAFAESLVLTGHYREALSYIKAAFENFPKQQNIVLVGYYEKLKLLEIFTLVKLGKKESKGFKFSNLYFLSKKYATILYLLMKLQGNKNDQKLTLQLNELVNETGFIKLLSLINITGEIIA